MRYIDLGFNGIIPGEWTKVNYELKTFASGELGFILHEDISNFEIVILQSFSRGEINDNLIKLQIVLNVLNKFNVKSIKYVVPFIPYFRQDRIGQKISSLNGSEMIINIINNSKVSEIFTYDVHNVELLKLFDKCIVHNLTMMNEFIIYINDIYDQKDVLIVFPDFGAKDRFESLFLSANFECITLDKRRHGDDVNIFIPYKIKNKTCIIVDDIIDTGSTIIEAAKGLIAYNVTDIVILATHGLFSDNAIDDIKTITQIKQVVVSDSFVSRINDQSVNKMTCKINLNLII